MPTSILSRGRLLERLGGPVSEERLEAALFASKAEAVLTDADPLQVSVTPDRLDLLSEGGLALYLEGALGVASGAVPLRVKRATATSLRILVDASVAPLRPAIAALLVQAPPDRPLDDGLLAEAVRFQELLHSTIGRDRRVMSLGIYPARRLRSPVRYALEPISDVEFAPLDGGSTVPAGRFYAEHPLAATYGAFGRTGDRCLTLRDARGGILSLPPVLNSRPLGSAAPGDRALLLEATGIRRRAVLEGLGLLLVVFASRGWSVRAVPVEGPLDPPSDGVEVVDRGSVELSASTLQALSGEDQPPEEVLRRLAQARLGARRVRGGWKVQIPPWRPDLLAPVDVAEDAILAGGLRAEEGLLPPGTTRGRRGGLSALRDRVRDLLLGLGFSEPATPVLVSETAASRLDERGPIRLANPVSREYAVVRDRLLLSHLEVLGRSTRFGYPQRLAEVAPVIVRKASAADGAESRLRAGLVIAADGAGFADVAAIVDYLCRALDVSSVREPADLAGAIGGRAARVRLAGETVAELGEVDPGLLEGLGVPVPVAFAEVDLTVLAPLLGSDDRTK